MEIKVVGSGVEESNLQKEENPVSHVLKLSMEKARAVAEREKGVILAADTIVYLEPEILGKPKDVEDAKRLLRKLSGKYHTVYTGFTILDNRVVQRAYQRVVESKVKIKDLSDEEIEWYVSTDEPMDKAGAYAVQGIGAFMVERIEGSYTNVVGLPLTEVVEALKEMGVLVFDKKGIKVK